MDPEKAAANLAAMQVEVELLDELVPYAANARTHSETQVQAIAASLARFGWTNPILLDGTTGIIAGHGRLAAAQLLRRNNTPIPRWADTSTAPVLRLTGLSEADKRAYILADNQLATLAGWDTDLLAAELAGLRDMDYPLPVIGFDDKVLAGLLKIHDNPPTAGLTDPDDAPDLPQHPVSELGDVWVMGNHRLICGDSLDANIIEALVQGQLCDLLHTDPPYGVAYTGGAKKWDEIKGDAEAGQSLVEFLTSAYASAVMACKPNVPWYIWHASNTTAEFYEALARVGRKATAQIIWVKNIMAGGFGDYRGKHEPAIYCSGGRGAWYGGRGQDTVWNVSRERNYQHPTQKPVELVERALNNSSKAGDLVLDLFSGSGSTLLACEKTGRHARVVELAEGYADVAVLRWQGFTGRAAVLEATGQTFAEVLAARRPDTPLVQGGKS